MTDIQRLLTDYVNHGSEAAFRELAERYLNLVYSTAVRLVGGDTHLAEDVAQTVFVDLAHLAKNLSGEVRLGGWLHRHTCFVAAKTLRGERRRQARERQAIEMNPPSDYLEARLDEVAPILDEAINRLGAADRAAVLLRFYERLDFRLVGEALGTSEAAAQKRVTRALEKLHLLLKHRGVSFSTAALGTALAGEAVSAAPAGLAASIPAAALASLAGETTISFSLLKFMATINLKTAVITAIIVASVVVPLLVQHRAQARIREQDEVWQRQTNELARVTADNQRLANLLAQAKNTRPLSDKQLSEVLRARSEVGLLRRNVREMTSAKTAAPLSPEDQLASLRKIYGAKVDRFKQWLETNPAEKIPELQNVSEETWLDAIENLTEDSFALAARTLRANAELRVFDRFSFALRKYAQDNNGQFPTDLSQLKPYFKSPIDDAILQRYEILPASNLVSELQPGGDWVITQKAPVNAALDLRSAIGLTASRMADETVTNRWTLIR